MNQRRTYGKTQVTLTLRSSLVKQVDYLVRLYEANRSQIVEDLLEYALEDGDPLAAFECLDCGREVSEEEAEGPACPHCKSPFTHGKKVKEVIAL